MTNLVLYVNGVQHPSEPLTMDFDSYGLPPFKYEIMAYLQRHSTSCTFNRHRLQGLRMSADTTAASTPFTEPEDYP